MKRWRAVQRAIVALSVGIVVSGSTNLANAQTFTWLGTLDSGTVSSAWGVSADGAVVVGTADFGGINRAFRWTRSGGMQQLPTLGGRDGFAWGVSADGTVIVGEARHTSGQLGGEDRAFRWTTTGGLENLTQTYCAQIGSGSYLIIAASVSSDGRYLVGTGYNAQQGRSRGFLLDTWRTGDTNGDGCIDDADLLNVLFAFGSAGSGRTRHEGINHDGIMDDADLLEVLFQFGNGC